MSEIYKDFEPLDVWLDNLFHTLSPESRRKFSSREQTLLFNNKYKPTPNLKNLLFSFSWPFATIETRLVG